MPLGSVLADRYVVAREVGRGGMGVIYEAHDSNLEREVAVKFLNAEFADDREAIQRFQQEAIAASRIGHPNICNVYDRGKSPDGIPYIVMELLAGESLAARLARSGRLESGQVARIVVQVLSALTAVHRKGIVHRDLKPENVFISLDDAGDETVKLLDFGISKYVGELIVNKLTKGGIALGTPYYMSPEQAQGKSELIDHRTDVWAAGVIMYESLTGNPPFIGESVLDVLVNIQHQTPVDPRTIVPNIPDDMVRAAMKALEKDPRQRFGDAAEFAAAIRACSEPAGEVVYELRTVKPAPVRFTPEPEASPDVDFLAGDTVKTPVTDVPVDENAATSHWPLPDLPERRTSTVGGLSWKVWALAAGTVVVMGTCMGAVAAVILSYRGADDEQDRTPQVVVPTPSTDPASEPAPGPAPEPVPTPVPAPPVAPAPEPDPEGPEIPTPPAVEVRLVGVPRGATVSYDGQPVTDNVVRGPMDHVGELIVVMPGRPPLRQTLALAVGINEIDLRERTGDGPREGRDAAVVSDAGH
jgi:serine/threonine protein kinase